MRLNLDMAQLQSMGEGVVLLDRQAQAYAQDLSALLADQA